MKGSEDTMEKEEGWGVQPEGRLARRWDRLWEP